MIKKMGAPVVVSGAMLQCDQGSMISFQASGECYGCNRPIGTIRDMAAMNLSPAGMCRSMANPAVSAATAAAGGVLTPQPCSPVPVGTWLNPGKILLKGGPCLTAQSTLACAYAGVISVKSAGQTQLITE